MTSLKFCFTGVLLLLILIIYSDVLESIWSGGRLSIVVLIFCGSVLSLREDVESSESVNYVGELQELSQRHLWPLPVYECTGEHGLAHEREFVCTVRLFSLTETGGYARLITALLFWL